MAGVKGCSEVSQVRRGQGERVYLGRVLEQQLELDMEQQTGFKLGKEYVKAVYCHPVYLTYVQSTSREMWPRHLHRIPRLSEAPWEVP